MNKLVIASDPRLAGFCRDIIAWHGYVSFLGLPSLQPSADVEIDELYVPHYVSRRKISIDKPTELWEVQDPVSLLSESRRLTVLGDPGSGKSTLVSWLAWHLASGFAQRLPGELDGLLPIPIVLRDLPPGSFSNLDSLIEAFCSLPVASNLNREILGEYILAGRCLFLVDGLDEIPQSMSVEIRSVLAKDIGRNYCLVTSRIVGFNRDVESARSVNAGARPESVRQKEGGELNETVCYIAPFSDEQIIRFTANWYREQGGKAAEHLSQDFINAVNSDGAIKSLARTPNLLTMMAQIFRVRARLPNGRALLYDDIAQAYLESIDTARKMKDEFSWKTKRRWLARIAFEMQMMRSIDGVSSKFSDKELLVDREDILLWLNEAIFETDGIRDENYASRYLDWIARRSGLLLPRGEGRYAFMHLSFQEYFAARYVKAQLEHPRWPTVSDPRVSRKALRKWFDSYGWSQIFVFLFELFSGSPGWAENLLGIIIANISREAGNKRMHKTKGVRPSDRLLVDLLTNPHAGISDDLRAKCMEYSAAIVIFEQVAVSHALMSSYIAEKLERSLLVKLLESPLTQSKALEWLASLRGGLTHLALDNLNASTWILVEPIIKKIDCLKFLSLSFVPMQDCSTISHMTDLEALSLRGTLISSVEQLRSFSKLTVLFLEGTKVEDVSALSDIASLEVVDLDNTSISDVEFVEKLQSIRMLSVCGTGVEDMSPLSGIKTLTHLAASSTKICDLESLISSASSLRYLDVSNTEVCDLKFLAEAKNLISCFIDKTRVDDIGFLAECKDLHNLWIDECDISDISSLAACKKIQTLRMSKTKVEDLGPLVHSKHLNFLAIDRTPVRDLSPLRGLRKLKFVSIVGCEVESTEGLEDMIIYRGKADA
ncbi:NACHT domain-containing protein [Xanthomonas melonis]|uniref:NACHT domain-containing protein n=1 Tax=Xanthomonas melonis TaxID=56456 RepID=A0ABS8NU32_9XANT|nr:NACHT domain-containing protein [Xanthomonas melonis]MCD0245613.1 NACHT domain-containing protein [Xanthomonas melonis]MCD0258275.1 NACHT domain-containing protein [Xanthomonas melonis]MCD0266593.1 NACHT domain-containing protein [Xanthomonas melonis]